MSKCIFTCMYVFVPCMCSSCRGQKRVSDCLELELRCVSCHVGSRTGTHLKLLTPGPLNNSFSDLFLFPYMVLWLHVYAHVAVPADAKKRVSDTWTGVTVCESPWWLLEIKLGSSAKAANDLDCRDTSPVFRQSSKSWCYYIWKEALVLTQS